MAASDENEKCMHPTRGKFSITNGQYARYQALLRDLIGLKLLLSPKRFLVVKWLWENQYLNAVDNYALGVVREDTFETFLVAAEKVTALRKTKATSDQIIAVAGEYVITHKIIWADRIVWEDGFVQYFLSQVLWCFYQAYPKFASCKMLNKEPLEHAVSCMLTLPDSDIDKLTTSIAILIPNMKSGGINDLFSSWVDGKLLYLSRRILNFAMHDKKASRKLLDAGKENGHTINLRLELANNVSGSNAQYLLKNALDMAKAVYGECHAITWHCTEELGKYYLDNATEGILRYNLSRFRGDRQQVTLELYKEFLNHAYEIEQSNVLDQSERQALSSLLREKVVPALAHMYRQNGQESNARKLVWKTVKDTASQLYNDNWTPFRLQASNSKRLMGEIHSLEEFDIFHDLKYSSLELILFPFDEISLLSATPSEEEKARKWHYVIERLPNGNIPNFKEITDWSPGLEGGFEPRTLQKVAENAPDKAKMVLELPYITYSHFKTSKAYRQGCSYDFYRKGSVNQQLQDWMKKNEAHYILGLRHGDYSDYIAHTDGWPSVGGALVDPDKGEVGRFLYDRETGCIKMTDRNEVSTMELDNPLSCKVLDVSQCEREILGFFNSTPGDTAAVDQTGAVSQGFNLVSAEWYDWKRFILHLCSSTQRQPELLSTDGIPIPVLGYIYGSWTDKSLQRQWRGLQVWVIQATLDQDNRSCHFVLDADDLCKSREHELLPSETRTICKFLNPALLRVMNHSTFKPYMCTMSEGVPDDFEGVAGKPNPNVQRDPIAEFSFRDAWDVEFAYKWWNRTWGDSRKKIMTEQLKEETARRREWNAECVPVLKQWVKTRK